jgi:hypothetical protein
MKLRKRKLRVGDWVEVRSKQEILETLDDNGQLDGMPFMPEMFTFCGQKFPVYKRAHKTCDTVFPVRGRRVERAVHLETRCDGSAHGGCQAGCLLFWKEEWLKPTKQTLTEVDSLPRGSRVGHDIFETEASSVHGCAEADIWSHTVSTESNLADPTYVCQATRLPYATKDLGWWEFGQYIEDLRSGNVALWQIFSGAIYFLYFNLSQAGIGLGRPLRWFNDRFYKLWGGTPFPRKTGTIPMGQPTPAEALDLQPGELVRIKSHDEILKTLNVESRNRGLLWDAEEVPYCGGTYPVLKRVTKIVNEKTGRIQIMKTPCIILDSVICQSRYSECRLFCPRSIYSYWREIWLERVEPHGPDGPMVVVKNQPDGHKAVSQH